MKEQTCQGLKAAVKDIMELNYAAKTTTETRISATDNISIYLQL